MLFRSNDTATTEIYTGSYTLSLHDALPIAAAIRHLRDDPSLATTLVEKGTKRFAETRQSWDQIAKGMLAEVEALTERVDHS